MKRKAFSLQLPFHLVDALDAAAFQKFGKKNGRNQIITDILTEWHEQQPASTDQPKPQKPKAARARQKPKRAQANAAQE
jgi:metal-responsive CopG/Arc/MetJ family transcriptional regulator